MPPCRKETSVSAPTTSVSSQGFWVVLGNFHEVTIKLEVKVPAGRECPSRENFETFENVQKTC